MADDVAISPGIQQFIESMGVYFEQFGISRICGRIFGLLMVAGRPLSLDDLAGILQVSRASASINARVAQAIGIADLVSLPGDRRDYYVLTDGSWEHMLQVNIDATVSLQRIAEKGLAELTDDTFKGQGNPEQLAELVDFCRFMVEELRLMTQHWHEYHEAKQKARLT